MPEPEVQSGPPSGGNPPPAPPLTGEPGGRPDPSDWGSPIGVVLEGVPLGDLGNRRVDARLLTALLLRGGAVAAWLVSRGIHRGAVEAAFPGSGWPLQPPLSWRDSVPDPADAEAPISVELRRVPLGDLGDRAADARLLNAIALRRRDVSDWLRLHGVDTPDIESEFPTSGWS